VRSTAFLPCINSCRPNLHDIIILVNAKDQNEVRLKFVCYFTLGIRHRQRLVLKTYCANSFWFRVQVKKKVTTDNL
jgi:hypothetical protein